MASVLRNPRLLLVICMTAGFSAAAPSPSIGEHDRHGSINMRVYRGNRAYAIPSSSGVNTLEPSSYSRRGYEASSPGEHHRARIPDGRHRRPVYDNRETLQAAESGRITGEARHAAEHRWPQPESTNNFADTRNEARRNTIESDGRRRGTARNGNRASRRGTRYGLRRRIFNTPSVEENFGVERDIRIPSPQPASHHVHQVAPNSKPESSRRRKWIHCHHDGIVAISNEADPQIIGI